MIKSRYLTMLMILVLLFYCMAMPAVSALGDDAVIEITAPLLSLTAVSTTDTSVELVWTSDNNSVDAATYQIYRDSFMIKSISSFTYMDIDLIPETIYKYLVKAIDVDGNVIAESNVYNATTFTKAEPVIAAPVNLMAYFRIKMQSKRDLEIINLRLLN